jgi:hypothetical protein
VNERDAWAAGLFEGEGSVIVRWSKNTSRTYVQISLEISDRDVVERFAVIAGFGKVTLRKPKKNRKPMFAWRGHGWSNARQLFNRFDQFLGKRRHEQFANVFSVEPPERSKHRILYRDEKGRVTARPRPLRVVV